MYNKGEGSVYQRAWAFQVPHFGDVVTTDHRYFERALINVPRSIVARSRKDAAAANLSADTQFVMVYDAARTLSLIIVVEPVFTETDRGVAEPTIEEQAPAGPYDVCTQHR